MSGGGSGSGRAKKPRLTVAALAAVVEAQRGEIVGLRERMAGDGAELANLREKVEGDGAELAAGAYTRPLHSSTFAVSDTTKHPKHHTHPVTPPNTDNTTSTRTPYPIQSAPVELKSGRV
jgi:hypothetical protein